MSKHTIPPPPTPEAKALGEGLTQFLRTQPRCEFKEAKKFK